MPYLQLLIHQQGFRFINQSCQYSLLTRCIIYSMLLSSKHCCIYSWCPVSQGEGLNSLISIAQLTQSRCKLTAAVTGSTQAQSTKMTTSPMLSTRTPVPPIMIQRFDGSNAFSKNWAEFKAGFGDVTGNFWLGNDKISQLTLSGCDQLTFLLQVWMESFLHFVFDVYLSQ